MKTILGLLAVGLLAGPMVANAVPFEFKFSGTVGANGTTIPGTSIGQTFEITILADNGSGSMISQSWSSSDYLSAFLNIGGGAYTASFVAAGTFAASTNASGTLTSIFLSDNGAGSLGGASIIVNGAHNIIFTSGGYADATQPTSASNFTVRAVPEPGTLALLTLGLAGLTLTRNRKGTTSDRSIQGTCHR